MKGTCDMNEREWTEYFKTHSKASSVFPGTWASRTDIILMEVNNHPLIHSLVLGGGENTAAFLISKYDNHSQID